MPEQTHTHTHTHTHPHTHTHTHCAPSLILTPFLSLSPPCSPLPPSTAGRLADAARDIRWTSSSTSSALPLSNPGTVQGSGCVVADRDGGGVLRHVLLVQEGAVWVTVPSQVCVYVCMYVCMMTVPWQVCSLVLLQLVASIRYASNHIS